MYCIGYEQDIFVKQNVANYGVQLLKGVLTAKEVYMVLSQRGCLQMFPLFTTVHHICTGHLPPSDIVRYREHANNSAL